MDGSNETLNTVNTTGVRSPWLHAWHDPLANLKTMASCVRLGDIHGDGDYKLIVCDLEKKVKVFKGTSLAMDYALLDTPSALSIVYTEGTGMPRIPSIAVAAGSYLFIYRQLKPYRKWSCPPLDFAAVEAITWNQLSEQSVTSQSLTAEAVAAAAKALTDARDSGSTLSARSMDLLSLPSDAARLAYAAESVRESREAPMGYVQQTLITCLDSLNKHSEDSDAVSQLVVGTESKHVYILPEDPINSNYKCKISLPSVPILFCVSGLFDIEWRIWVACRDGKIYSIKNGDSRGAAIVSGTVIDAGSQVIAMSRQEKFLWVATMDRAVSCYSARGKRVKNIIMPEDITEICVVSVKRAKLSHLLLVGLSTGEVKVYREGAQVYAFNVEPPIIALRHGCYGREENSLICVHGKGALTINMWRRTADVESMNAASGPPPEQDIPLPVPKKTKLYVEQTQREREQGPAMHRAFQRDLCRLRLETARAYVKTLTDGHMGASPLASGDVRINVQVLGLGPSFVLKVTLQNAGAQPLFRTKLLLSFDANLYVMGYDSLSKQCSVVPILIPGVKHIVEANIKNIDPQGRAGQISVMLYQSSDVQSSIPMLSASVKMPPSELSA